MDSKTSNPRAGTADGSLVVACVVTVLIGCAGQERASMPGGGAVNGSGPDGMGVELGASDVSGSPMDASTEGQVVDQEPSCRTYRTAFSGTYNEDADDTIRGTCSFEPVGATLVCADDRTVGFSTRDTRVYADVADFVAEGAAVGMLRWQSNTNADLDGSVNYIERATFDSNHRVQLIATFVDGEVEPYSEVLVEEWDELGRPTAGSKDFVGPRTGWTCIGSQLTWSYDDAELSVTFVEEGGAGDGCFADSWQGFYDADFNLVSETLGYGEEAEIGVFSVDASETVCLGPAGK